MFHVEQYFRQRVQVAINIGEIRLTMKNKANILLFIRSLVFYLGLGLSTLAIAPLVILCWPLSFRFRYELTRHWTRFNIWFLQVSCNIDYELSGTEHIPPPEKATIVLAKHQSSWETLFLHKLFPPMAWVVKRELLWIPLFGWALAAVDPIAIDRKASSSSVRQILEQGKKHLSLGHWVLLFPEGTRTAPGQRKRYGTGGPRLAKHSGYPILPVAHNAGEFWPRRGFIKKPGTVKVVIGPLIQDEQASVESLVQRTEEWIEQTMLQISLPKT